MSHIGFHERHAAQDHAQQWCTSLLRCLWRAGFGWLRRVALRQRHDLHRYLLPAGGHEFDRRRLRYCMRNRYARLLAYWRLIHCLPCRHLLVRHLLNGCCLLMPSCSPWDCALLGGVLQVTEAGRLLGSC